MSDEFEELKLYGAPNGAQNGALLWSILQLQWVEVDPSSVP